MEQLIFLALQYFEPLFWQTDTGHSSPEVQETGGGHVESSSVQAKPAGHWESSVHAAESYSQYLGALGSGDSQPLSPSADAQQEVAPETTHLVKVGQSESVVQETGSFSQEPVSSSTTPASQAAPGEQGVE